MDIIDLQTTRLVLRKLTVNDVYDLYEITSDSDITEYLTWYPHPDTNHTKNFIQSVVSTYSQEELPSQWAIALKSSDKLIGITGCNMISHEHNKAEISFLMNPAFGNKGFMKEANKAVVNYLFSIGFNRIQAKAEISNIASCKVLEGCGLQHEGTFRDYLIIKGRYRTYKYYSILKFEQVG